MVVSDEINAPAYLIRVKNVWESVWTPESAWKVFGGTKSLFSLPGFEP
jgi:hypothetical protein